MTYRMFLTNFDIFVSIVNISLLSEDIEILSKLIFFNIIIRILLYECENTCMDIF